MDKMVLNILIIMGFSLLLIFALISILLYFKLNIRYIAKLIRRKKREGIIIICLAIFLSNITPLIVDAKSNFSVLDYINRYSQLEDGQDDEKDIKQDEQDIKEDGADIDDKENDIDGKEEEEEKEEIIVPKDEIPPVIKVFKYQENERYFIKDRGKISIYAQITDDDSGVSEDTCMFLNGKRISFIKLNNQYVFEFTPEYSVNEYLVNEIMILALDQEGNESQYAFELVVDVSKPRVLTNILENVYETDGKIYVNRNDNMEIPLPLDIVMEDNCEIESYSVLVNGELLTESLIYTQLYTLELDIDLISDKTEITIDITDVAGNSYVTNLVVFKDVSPPNVDISVDKVDIKDIFNKKYLSYSESIKAYISGNPYVELICKDIWDDASGISDVWFFYEEEEGFVDIKATFKDGEYIADVVLPDNRFRRFFVAAIDNLGNVNSNNERYLDILCNSSIPVIEAELTGNHINYDNRVFYKDSLFMDLHIHDDLALKSVEIYLDDRLIQAENEILNVDLSNSIFTTDRRYRLDLKSHMGEKDKAFFKIVVKNYGDNEAIVEYELIKDTRGPDISNITLDKKEFDHTGEYEYFSNLNIEIGFNVADYSNLGEDMTANIASVTCNLMVDGTVIDQKEAIMQDGGYRLNIPTGFRGYIEVIATDHLGNEERKNSALFIAEGEGEAKEGLRINLSKPGDRILSEDVSLTVKAIGSFSGIREINYRVIAPYDVGKNQEKSINIDNEATYSLVGKDKNLITSIEFPVLVNNNSNDIVITVEITDNAGYKSSDTVTLNIDKTSPRIEVSFDNYNNQNEYYNENRLAKILVYERNFDDKLLHIKVNNKDGAVPTPTKAVFNKNDENPDDSTAIIFIEFDTDGEYSFEISVFDMAGNSCEYQNPEFVIDKTSPMVELEFNNALSNEIYVNQERIAYIKVVEKNFDENGLVISTVSGETLGINSWQHKGDEHIARLDFTKEGEYEFNVYALDKALNQSATISSGRFIIDTTAPTISITGVANGSANNGQLRPVVEVSDEYISEDSLNVRIIDSTGKEREYEHSVNSLDNNIVYIYQDFERVKENDDLYTLAVSVSDLAGNTTESQIVFSVNRFGSVYSLSESTLGICNSYINEPTNVSIIETNIDELQREKIKVTLMENGEIKLLTKEDYQVNKLEGIFKNQYEYLFDKRLFNRDGSYMLSLYSVDKAGNINESLNPQKDAEVAFIVDKTSPVAFGLNFGEGEVVKTNTHTGKLIIKDNMMLDTAEIYVNDTVVKAKKIEDTYSFDFSNDNIRQNIRVEAIDRAGNRLEKQFDGVLLNGNIYVRIFESKQEVIGLFACVAVFLTLVALVSKKIKGKR